MKVTYKKGKGDKIHISVDGEYSFTVDEAYFYSLNLKENDELTADELKDITLKAGERRAYNYAVSLLSRREHTVKEITDKLNRKGYGQFAPKITERLALEGYLSDERFAGLYVRELINYKGYGRRRIKDELFRKGISKEIADDVLAEIELPENRLYELIEKKYMKYLDDEKGIQKTINALLRLGYSYGEIRDALKKIADETEVYEVYDE
ncbi:MAG: regulatory protein RecX [Clostridia bacterium]|nr:regulatory protein RecX [Clostridia bacterium]